MAEETFGPYRLLSLLGRGGMGEVHEAYDTKRERVVALKRFIADDPNDLDLQERFRRESRIAARLDSPHVVPIHDFGVIDDRLYIDMRLVRGGDLGARLATRGPLAPDQAVTIVGQLADALDTAHAAGLVHRDVKPSNALLTTRSGQDFTYLTDFGIVHMADPTSAERLTATGSFLGTPAYMAPEQLVGGAIDRRLDVYALGCLLVAALTGHPPFAGDRMRMMYQHMHQTPPAPSRERPELPAAIDAVIAAALAKHPNDRPHTAGAFAEAARRALASPSSPRLGPERPAAGPSSSPTAVDSRVPPPGRYFGNPVPASTPPATAPPASDHSSARLSRGRLAAVAVAALAAIAVVLILGLRSGRVPYVSAASVEGQIVSQTGLRPEQVTCPSDLPAEVGASIVCQASRGGSSQGLRVAVTSTENGQVRFDITTA